MVQVLTMHIYMIKLYLYSLVRSVRTCTIMQTGRIFFVRLQYHSTQIGAKNENQHRLYRSSIACCDWLGIDHNGRHRHGGHVGLDWHNPLADGTGWILSDLHYYGNQYLSREKIDETGLATVLRWHGLR